LNEKVDFWNYSRGFNDVEIVFAAARGKSYGRSLAAQAL